MSVDVNEEKKFVIKEVFENVSNMNRGGEKYGEIQEHLGVLWRINLVRSEPLGTELRFRLECLKPECSENEWSINTDIVIKIGESEHCTLSKMHSFTQESMLADKDSFIHWGNTNKYLVDGKLPVEFSVTITDAVGVDLLSKKLKNFDDDVAKEFSDVVLMAGNRKFFVYKMYLIPFVLFQVAILWEIRRIGKIDNRIERYRSEGFSEVSGVYSRCLTNFTVSRILKLADFFDAKTAIRRCEEFLRGELAARRAGSEKTMKDKFEMANKYKLEDLKKKCISGLKTSAEFRAIVPEDSTEIDSDTWKELLLKSASLF